MKLDSTISAVVTGGAQGIGRANSFVGFLRGFGFGLKNFRFQILFAKV